MMARRRLPIPRLRLARTLRRLAGRPEPRQLAYVLLSGGQAGFGAAYAVAVVVLAVPLAVSILGLPILGVAVVAARGWGRLQRGLVGAFLDDEVLAPLRFPQPRGPLRWTLAAVTDATGWRAITYLVARAPLAVAGAAVAAFGAVSGVVYTTYPLWRAVLDPTTTDAEGRARRSAVHVGEWYADTGFRALLVAVVGIIVLATLPSFARLVATVDRRLVHGLLAPTEADLRARQGRQGAALRAAQRLRTVDQARGSRSAPAPAAPAPAAVGPAAPAPVSPGDGGEVAGRNGGAAPTPVGVAGGTDRVGPDVAQVTQGGLGPSLAALTAGTGIPIRLHLDLNGCRLAPDVEHVLQLGASVLVSNVVTHSRARTAELSAVGGRGSVILRVTDDGCGGATPRSGGGLSRLSDWIVPVEGLMVITSPEGGPTDVTVAVPLRDGSARGNGAGVRRDQQGMADRPS